MSRNLLTGASRIVVKVGTGLLTDVRRQLDSSQMQQIVRQIAEQRCKGREVILVSSGAVGAGMGALGYERRPAKLANLQACAAVGQLRLMAAYERLFREHSLTVAQLLLIHDDLRHKERHLNARNTLVTLLQRGVVPIINENDTVSFTELRFGDNDHLAALVASLLPADVLIVLTSVEGVIENYGQQRAKRVSVIHEIDEKIESTALGTQSGTAIGGMASKIQAAKVVMRSGIPMIIGSGKKPDALARILNGEEEGTLFVPRPYRLKGRKRWIAFFHHPRGTVIVDNGARKALREKGRSLLLPGISNCQGQFSAGEVVKICDENGTEFARGIARCSASQIQSDECLGEEVVHRDDLVVL